MYAGIAIDGNASEVLDDLPKMKIDVLTIFDIKTTGLELIRRKLAGKMCIKVVVDMQTTLAIGSPEEVAREADELVETFHTPQGGFIAQVTRWHRPEFPSANVLASVQAFNRFRRA
jgi:uroporphyrinogen-III decarboxylase